MGLRLENAPGTDFFREAAPPNGSKPVTNMGIAELSGLGRAGFSRL